MDDIFEDTGEETLWERIRSIYWRYFPYNLRPGNLIGNIKRYFFKKYWKVKPKYLSRFSWIDTNHLLIHYMFQIVCDFYEKECGDDCPVDWKATDCPKNFIEVNGDRRYVIDVIKELTEWWKWYCEEVDNILYKMREDYQQYSPKPLFKKYKGDNPMIGYTMNTEFPSEEQKQKHDELFQKLINYENELIAELDRKLHLIVDIKNSLWT